jgi:hypothetical protein
LAADGLQKAVEHTAQALDAGVSDEHLWMGRQVHVVDGTGIALPDTEANQDDYPQPSQQKLGCGFPVLRLVAFMSLSTGAVSRYCLGNLHDHEQRLFQELRTHLQADDVVLGDRTSAPLPTSPCSSVKALMASFVAIRPATLACTPSSVWAKMTPLCVGAPPTIITPHGSMPRWTYPRRSWSVKSAFR